MFGLDPDISLMDTRNTLRLSEDDGRKNNTVMFGLDPDISLMDLRNALRLSEDDRRKNNTVIPVLLFFPVVPVPSISFVIPRLDRGICKGDPRVKPEDDKEKKPLFRGA